MKAIVLDHYGPPADLELRDIPKPEPADGEVLVKAHATAVNDWDWCFARGKPYLYRLLYGLRSPKVAELGFRGRLVASKTPTAGGEKVQDTSAVGPFLGWAGPSTTPFRCQAGPPGFLFCLLV